MSEKAPAKARAGGAYLTPSPLGQELPVATVQVVLNGLAPPVPTMAPRPPPYGGKREAGGRE